MFMDFAAPKVPLIKILVNGGKPASGPPPPLLPKNPPTQNGDF